MPKEKLLHNELEKLTQAFKDGNSQALLNTGALPQEEQVLAGLVNRALEESRATGAGRNTAYLASLKSILNGMEALICVCDPGTFEVMFLNDSIRANFGIEGDGIGHVCYELLQNRSEPCETCPYAQLLLEPERVFIWEHEEAVKGSVLRKTARLIDWAEDRKGHLEYAIDITEVRVAQDMLKQTVRETEYYNHLLHMVNRVSTLLLQADAAGFEDNLLESMGIMGEAAGVDRVYIWKNSTVNGELCCSPWRMWNREGFELMQDASLQRGISYRHVLPDWEESFLQKKAVNGIAEEMLATERALLTRHGVKSALAVPIYLKDEFWGFIGFDDCRNQRLFLENEEKVLRSAGEMIAAAMVREGMEKNILNLEIIADQIYYDALTGIYNRRFLDERIKRIIASVSRSGGVLSLLMVDIDYFKNYNDHYGHSEGDICLKMVADTLCNSITRAEDFVVRYGGEEFVIVLPNTDEAGAGVVAGKILANMRNANIPHRYSNVASYVSVSIGGTCGKAKHLQEGDDYIRRADEMLYKAKQAGRNRYRYAPLHGKASQFVYREPAYAGNLGNALASITMMPVLSDGNVEDAARVICEAGCRALNVHRVGVWMLSENEEQLQSVAFYNLPTDEFSVQDNFGLSGRDQYLGILKTKRLLVVHDVRQPNPLSGFLDDYGPNICAMMDSPIRVRGQLVGVVCIEQDRCEKYPEKREWTIEEQNFASSLADLMAVALVSAEKGGKEKG